MRHEGEPGRAHDGSEPRGAGDQRLVGGGGPEYAVDGRQGCDLRAQGGRARDRRARANCGCQCQIGVQAQFGVIGVSARAFEAGWNARVAERLGMSRVMGCSRGQVWCGEPENTLQHPRARVHRTVGARWAVGCVFGILIVRCGP